MYFWNFFLHSVWSSFTETAVDWWQDTNQRKKDNYFILIEEKNNKLMLRIPVLTWRLIHAVRIVDLGMVHIVHMLQTKFSEILIEIQIQENGFENLV